MRKNQYGGTKGSGTNYFLINTYHQIMTALEDNTKAVSIISIDFSKAFNRMDHSKCIEAFTHKGASHASLNMIAAFLRNRTMSVKVGQTFSTPRPVHGGSPQGTKLGNFLFAVTIDLIEEKNHPLYIRSLESYENDQITERVTGSLDFFTSTPYKAGTTDGVMRYVDESGRGIFSDESAASAHEEDIPADNTTDSQWVDKFVDDVNGGQSHSILSGAAHISERKEVRETEAAICQELYNTIEENATRINMKVNPTKTKLICISSAVNYDVESYVTIGGEKLKSSDSLKILGYTFGNRPNAAEHIRTIRRDFALKSWAIRNF